MKIEIVKTDLKEIQSFRGLFLQENNFQIRYDACHFRGWSDSYLVAVDGVKIGYGSVKGKENLKDRDALFEFYIIPSHRKMISLAFSEMITVSGVSMIECQSNDFVLSSMLYEFSNNIYSDTMLFGDDRKTELTQSEVHFRPRKKEDVAFEHTFEPVGDYVLDKNGEVVATGGFMLHYNMPFADLYMEVKPQYRRKGLGSFLVQELKKQCYLAQRVPAARCSITNLGSRGTLSAAGLSVCGFMLSGTVNKKIT